MNPLENNNKLSETLIKMGEIKISRYPSIITCVGLGSCIGLYLYDNIRKIGGGVHIMLPNYDKKKNNSLSLTHFADHACKILLNGLILYECNPSNIKAKIAGGADILKKNTFDIGKRNAETVKQQLSKLNIEIIAEDIGGNLSRTTRFNSYTGELIISNSFRNTFIF